MTFISRLARGAGRITGSALRSPLVKGAAGMVPGLGTALTVASVGMNVMGGIRGSGSGGMPPMPGMPSMPGMGERKIFRNDANVPDALKPYVISRGDLKSYHRAPAGFVIRHDQNGDAFAVPKKIARDYFGWKPAKKPLLSIRDTNAIRRAGTVINKLKKFEKTVQKIANFRAPKTRQILIGKARK